jgi:hypothetical protein
MLHDEYLKQMHLLFNKIEGTEIKWDVIAVCELDSPSVEETRKIKSKSVMHHNKHPQDNEGQRSLNISSTEEECNATAEVLMDLTFIKVKGNLPVANFSHIKLRNDVCFFC